jgi:hypothetical protein
LALIALLAIVAAGLGAGLVLSGGGNDDLTVLTSVTASPRSTVSPAPAPPASDTQPPSAAPEIVSLLAWDEFAARWAATELTLPAPPSSESVPILLTIDRAAVGRLYEVTLGVSACPNSGGVTLDSLDYGAVPDAALMTTPGPARTQPDATTRLDPDDGRLAAWGALFAERATWQRPEPCPNVTSLRIRIEARSEKVFIVFGGHLSNMLPGRSSLFAEVDGTRRATLEIEATPAMP